MSLPPLKLGNLVFGETEAPHFKQIKTFYTTKGLSGVVTISIEDIILLAELLKAEEFSDKDWYRFIPINYNTTLSIKYSVKKNRVYLKGPKIRYSATPDEVVKFIEDSDIYRLLEV